MIAPIETSRLVLQPITAQTAQDIVAGDFGALRPGAGWPTGQTIEGLLLEIDRGSSPARWLIVLDGSVIGDVGCKGGPGPDGSVEIGYAVAPGYHGCGYGSEAVAAFVEWVLDREDVRRVVASTLADNLPSRRVLEKAGFAITSSADGHVYWLRETAS